MTDELALQNELLDVLTDLSGDGLAVVWHFLAQDEPNLSIDEVISAALSLMDRDWLDAVRRRSRDENKKMATRDLHSLRTDYAQLADDYSGFDDVGVYISLTAAGKAERRRRYPDPQRLLDAYVASASSETGIATVLGASEPVARRALDDYVARLAGNCAYDSDSVRVEPHTFEVPKTGDVIEGVRLEASLSCQEKAITFENPS